CCTTPSSATTSPSTCAFPPRSSRPRSSWRPIKSMYRPPSAGGGGAPTVATLAFASSRARFPGQTQERAPRRDVEPSRPEAFGDQQRAEERVDRRWRNCDLACRFAQPATPLPCPSDEHREEERAVGVRELFDRESAAREPPPQLLTAVPSQLPGEQRVVAAQ